MAGMKSRTIVAMLFAAGAVAMAAVAPTAGAAWCSDQRYFDALDWAAYHERKGDALDTKRSFASAATEERAARRAVRYGPVPCEPWLRTMRTHVLREYEDYIRKDQAYGAGRVSDAIRLAKAGYHEVILAHKAWVGEYG